MHSPATRGTVARRGHSLRGVLAVATGAIATLALVTVGALIWSVAVLHRTTATTAAAVESVYLLEEAEIALLLHGRAEDHIVMRGLEATLRENLAAAREHVRSAEEAQALEKASANVEEYLASSLAPASPTRELFHGEAYAALENVIAVNRRDARDQRAAAQRWEATITAAAIALGVLLVAIATAAIAWLRWRALHPVLVLADAMRRFGSGDRAARAAETGPAELREMSATFNEMANALVTHRHAQLAMLAGVAHDLRQPLTALVLSTSMLDPEKKTPAELRRPIEITRRQVGRLERMIGDFLDMAKLDAEQLELRLRREDVREPVRNAVELHDGAARDRIALRLPADPVRVECDALRIEQVVANLVSNALKYSPPDSPVDVEVDVRGGEAAIRVTDRGPGLSAEDQARLFEPFRRVGSAAREVPGIGLGLFVVRRIVIAHRGRIEVDSERGRGARFVVYLPLS